MSIFSKTIEYFTLAGKNFLNNLLEIFDFFHSKVYIGITVLLNLLSWISVVFINLKAGDGPLILHYNVDFGVDLIGFEEDLFIIPLLGLSIFLINLILLTVFARWENAKFLSHFLFTVSLLVNLFLLISLGPIYFVNFR